MEGSATLRQLGKQRVCIDYLIDLCKNCPGDALAARVAWGLLLRQGFRPKQIEFAKLYLGLESVQQGRHWYWKTYDKTPEFDSGDGDSEPKREPDLQEQMYPAKAGEGK